MKIYLAGPDVFRNDAEAYLKTAVSKCEAYLHTGLSPLDTSINLEALNASTTIFQGNISLINQCDVVMANIEPFRGPNVDDGTAFEIGYAYALGKRIYGYMENCDDALKDITETYPRQYKFPNIEDFNLPRNLMIVESILSSGGSIYNYLSSCLNEIYGLDSL